MNCGNIIYSIKEKASGPLKKILQEMVVSSNFNLLRQKELELVSLFASYMLVFGAVASIPFGIYWDKGVILTLGLALYALLTIPVVHKITYSNIKFANKIRLFALAIILVQLGILAVYGENITHIYWIIPTMVLIFCSVSNSDLVKYIIVADAIIFILYTFTIFQEQYTLIASIVQLVFIFFIIADVFMIHYLHKYLISEKIKDYLELNEKKEEVSTLYDEIVIREEELIATNDELVDYTNKLLETNKKVDYLSSTDVLTGLPNRKAIIDQINYTIDAISGTDKYFAFIQINLNNFKKVNESLGHNNGDDLLIQTSKRLKEILDGKDTVGRIGGDEFAVLVMRDLDKDEIFGVCERILSVFDKEFLLSNDKSINITARVGVSIWLNDALTSEEIMNASDSAMHKAKDIGGNSVQFYQEGMQEKILYKIDLENKMMMGFENKEFYLNYQPIYDRDNKIVSFEALLRWETEGKSISPGEFIPIAEANGFIIKLGNWVIVEVCDMIKKIQKYYSGDFKIAVNVSAVQIRNSNLIPSIFKIVQEKGIDTKYLEIEITESVFTKEQDKAIAAISELSKAGITIALDDFGTGYSSMGYLMNLPIDILKIDKSFVDLVEEDIGNKKEIVVATINMAHSLKIKCLAEGVETQKQLDYLIKNECDYIQGFYLSRPLPEDKLKELLTGHED